MRGIFRIGSLWAVIQQPNDALGSRCQQRGEAGGDAGGDEKQHRHGYAGDIAVERARRTNLRSVRGMERHPADPRYRDH